MARGTNKASKNEVWQKIFDRSGERIFDSIDSKGYFDITAPELKQASNEVDGPDVRNLAKFDKSYSLPDAFKTGADTIKDYINIMPLGYTDKVYTYRLGRFNAYAPLEIKENESPKMLEFPKVQTISPKTIPSENAYIDAAFSSGMLDQALGSGRDHFLPVLHGRMGSGTMNFNIGVDNPQSLQINGAQIEIDATFEDSQSVVVIEAKAVPEADFLVRQLYYPFYVIRNRGVTKPVRPTFLLLLGGNYYFNEYTFDDPNNYSTIRMVSQKAFRFFDNLTITLDRIVGIYRRSRIVSEPAILPQANSYLRFVKTLALLNEADDEENSETGLNKRDIASVFGYAERQGDYYGNLVLYLGLCSKVKEQFIINDRGRELLVKLDGNEGKLALIELLLQHQPFRIVFKYLLDNPMKRTMALTSDDKCMLASEITPHLTKKYGKSTILRRIESTAALVRSAIFESIDEPQ